MGSTEPTEPEAAVDPRSDPNSAPQTGRRAGRHRGRRRTPLGVCWSVASLCGRGALALFTILILAAGLFYARLTQGPVTLPGLADIVAAQINAEAEDIQVRIGEVALRLGQSGLHSGVRLYDVSLKDSAGDTLIGVKRVGVRFALADLIHGRVQPEVITIFAPDALLIRLPDGGLQFAMGNGRGMRVTPGGTGATDLNTGGATSGATPGAFREFMDALAGQGELPEALARLRRVEIRGARLTFRDLLNDGTWHSEDARIRLERDEEGVRGAISVAVIDDGTPGAAVRLMAERKRGAQEVNLRADFGQIRTSVLSGQLPELAWLGVLDGTVEGRAMAVVDGAGQVTKLAGEVIAENGSLAGLGEASAFDIAQVQFAVDPLAGTVTLNRVAVSAEALDAQLTGLLALQLDGAGEPASLSGQFNVGDLYLRLPEVFAEPLAFDDGQINFRLDTRTKEIRLVDTRLANGPLAFQMDGRILSADGGWITDLRAEAVNMTVQDLMAHWPYVAAANARTWVRDNILEAQIPSFLAQMRFGDGEPMLALDFDYTDLTSTYIEGMPPIAGARGRGHLTYHALYLDMDEGWVTPPGGEPIGLAGSTVEITDFWGIVTPADIRVIANGRTADVLSLIDQQPLGLVSKLGVDLGQVAGQAEIVADLDFPLISDLLVEDVGAEAEARLTAFAMPFDLEGTALDVRSNELLLSANTRNMRLRGPVRAAGSDLRLDWRENYGATPSTRRLELTGQTTPALMSMLGADDMPVEGSVPFAVTLNQTGTAAPTFRLNADLAPVRMALDAIGWTKPKGRDGAIVLEGTLGDTMQISAFNLTAGGLQANGALSLTADGGLAEARFSRLVIPGLADVAGTLRIAQDDALVIDLTRGSVDLSRILESEAGGEPGPTRALRAQFRLDRMTVSEKIGFARTRGTYRQSADGTRQAEIDAWMAGGTPVVIRLETGTDGRTHLGLATQDAGAVLAEADLYQGASGGRLVLDAAFGGPGERDAWGKATIENITVRSQSTFRDVLRDGGLDDAKTAVSSGGIRFRQIVVPFAFEDGMIMIEDAVATSPALALKLNGTLNESTDDLDLVGVLTPAYVVTGALNRVPVLGRILSGGEGEGILAMTFALSGQMRDPQLSVNPLSLLAPGMLRRVFSGRSRGVSDGFAEQLRRPNQ